jgi:hypothetical protein
MSLWVVGLILRLVYNKEFKVKTILIINFIDYLSPDFESYLKIELH